MSSIDHSRVVLSYLKGKTNEVVLFYSGGRDSVVLLDILCPHFATVHVVFMYFLPGMKVYDPYLRHVQKYPNAKLYQYQHWQTANLLKAGYLSMAQREKIPTLKLKDIEEKARIDTGCQWIIQGFKKSDGLSRRLFLNTYLYNAINEKAFKAFPLAEWSQKNVEDYIRLKNLIKPIVFKGQKTHGIGLNESALLYLRERHPDDLQTILNVFPLAGKILFEHDYRQQNPSITEVQG